MAEENHRYAVNHRARSFPWKSLCLQSGRLDGGRALLFVGSKFHGQEERKDGPVATMQVQESGNSDFQSLISLPHIPSTFKIEMC